MYPAMGVALYRRGGREGKRREGREGGKGREGRGGRPGMPKSRVGKPSLFLYSTSI